MDAAEIRLERALLSSLRPGGKFKRHSRAVRIVWLTFAEGRHNNLVPCRFSIQREGRLSGRGQGHGSRWGSGRKRNSVGTAFRNEERREAKSSRSSVVVVVVVEGEEPDVQ